MLTFVIILYVIFIWALTRFGEAAKGDGDDD